MATAKIELKPNMIERDGKQVQEGEILTLTPGNIPALAALIWSSLPGKNVAEKQEHEQKLYSLIRESRNKEMESNKKPRKSEEQVIVESVGKALADLQTAYVQVAGVRLKIGDVLRLAATQDSPLKEASTKFLEDHNLVAVERKETSKGKARIYLLYRDKSKVPEGTPSSLIAKQPKAAPKDDTATNESAAA